MKVIPEEITEALNQPYGFTLLIKGKAGTGKSTLALEILHTVEDSNPIYISTRINPNLLYKQFSWIKEFLPEKNIIDATAFEFEHPLPLDDQYSFFNALKLQKFPDFVKTLFLKIDSAQSGTVVIDSWDALTILSQASWGQPTSLLANFILELIRQKNLNLILVEETEEETYLDYLVDGIINLKEALFDGDKRIRQLQLNKLRGISINQPFYLFTLNNGRFTTFLPTQPLSFNNIKKFPLINDKNSKVSTGIVDLDNMLDGGFKRGSIFLFEILPALTYDAGIITFTTILNFLMQGRGIIGLPPPGRDINQEVEIVKFMLGDAKVYEKCMRIIQIGKENESLPPYISRVIPKTNLDYFNHIKSVIEQAEKRSVKPPFLIILSLDVVLFNFPYSEIRRDTLRIRSQIKGSGNILFIVAKIGDEYISELEKVVDAHFVLRLINHKLTLYGKIPETNIHAVNFDTSEGYLQIKLVPIV